MRNFKYSCFFLSIFGNFLFSQDLIGLKSEYDSIITLKTNNKDELLINFFNDHDNHPNQLQLALCYHEYSKKTFRKNINTAIRYAKQAIEIRLKYKDTIATLQSLYALGYYYNVRGSYSKSIQSYIKILELGQEDNLVAKTQTRLGEVYTKNGDFDKAKINFTKAELYFKDYKENKLLFKNHICIAQMFEKMRWSNNKGAYYIQQADSLLNIIETTDMQKLLIYQISGNLYDERQEYDKAINNHKKAIKISERMKDSSYLSMSYSNIGITYNKSNKHLNAFISYNKALKYAGKNIDLKAPVYNNLGDYYITQEQYEQAIKHYHKAITNSLNRTDTLAYRTLPDIESLKTSPYKLDLLGYLTDKANAWINYYEYNHQKEHLELALKTFTIADQLVDVIRFESTEFQSKLFWREQSAVLYMKAVQVSFLLHKPKEAFYFIEKNKALLLLEDHTQEKAKADANLPEELSEREFELRRLIHLAEEQLNDNMYGSTFKIDSIKDIIYDQKRIHEKFVDSLEVGYPKYYQYKRKLQVLSYDESEIFLKKNNQVAIYYILNDTDGYGLVVANGSPQFFKITDIPRLHKNIKSLQQKLTIPLYTKEDVVAYQKVAHNIYKTIFPIPEQTSFINKQLLIIPDGNLQHIPFEVLMSSPTRIDSYLLHQCTISYAYSLSFLKLNETLSRNPEHNFIGFAPVHFKDTTLVDLSRSTTEITQIASLFSGEVYDNKKASKSNFMTNAANYKIIHLSTHADVGEKTSPWIAFYDDKLSLEELYATKNQADLVVLSACNTSLGELKTGEGVMSLARGFFSTGTRSVISTLWSANEKSTNEIMTVFYENLKNGATKTEALQNAKRDYLQNHSGVEISPYYWGAPILIGNTDKIVIKNNLSRYLLLGIGLFIVLLGIFIKIHKQKKSKAHDFISETMF